MVTNAIKTCGAVRSAFRSTVALAISRAVSLHSALVTPLPTLNNIAWFPLVQQGGPWLSKLNDQWFWIFGFEPRRSKEYVLLSWLDFNTWEITASKMAFKLLPQMLRAPPAELLIELRNDCRVNNTLGYSVPCGLYRRRASLFHEEIVCSRGLTICYSVYVSSRRLSFSRFFRTI